MHQIIFRLGLRPKARWGSLQRAPDPLAGFKGPTSKGRGKERVEGEDWGGVPSTFLRIYAHEQHNITYSFNTGCQTQPSKI